MTAAIRDHDLRALVGLAGVCLILAGFFGSQSRWWLVLVGAVLVESAT